jgi:hypothetical protein
VDFKETAIALDPNHEASIFAKGATDQMLVDWTVEILATTTEIRNA